MVPSVRVPSHSCRAPGPTDYFHTGTFTVYLLLQAHHLPPSRSAWERTNSAVPVKILALSANGSDIACQRACIEAGMDGILYKPLDADKLQRYVEGRGGLDNA